MSKKIIAAVLAAVLIIGGVIGAVAGGKAYSANKASRPEFTEDNLAETSVFTKKDAEKPLKKAGFADVELSAGEYVDVDFQKNVAFNSLVLEEKGDNVKAFRLYKFEKGEWKKFYEQDRIMSYRLCTFEQVLTNKLRIEIVECDEPVKLENAEIYYLEKSKEPARVAQYLTFGAQDEIIRKRDTHDKGFSGYYDVVTDVVVYDEITVDENGNIGFINTEKTFGYNLMALKSIIGERKVNIWVSFALPEKISNVDEAVKNILGLVEKYGVYGVEFGSNLNNKLVKAVAEKTKISVSVTAEDADLSKSVLKAAETVNVVAGSEPDERGDIADIETATVNTVKALKKEGVDMSKVLLAVNAYGMADGEKVNYHGNEMKLGKFNKIVKAEGKPDVYIQSYAGARDITKFAQETGCAGVAIFDAAADSSYLYPYSLHRAVNEVINSVIVKK